jgi:hypothetical protein
VDLPVAQGCQRELLFAGELDAVGCRQRPGVRELLDVGKVGRFIRDLERRRDKGPAHGVQARDQRTDPRPVRHPPPQPAWASQARHPPPSSGGETELAQGQPRGQDGGSQHQARHQVHDPNATPGATERHVSCDRGRQRKPRRASPPQVFDGHALGVAAGAARRARLVAVAPEEVDAFTAHARRKADLHRGGRVGDRSHRDRRPCRSSRTAALPKSALASLREL